MILKVSPDEDYRWQARLAETYGCAAITAINTVKGLRLDPETGEPYLKNRYGAVSGRAIKPIGLRVVAELRDAGIRLPIIANGGIRDFDDCREYLWAGADAVSLGSAVWLQPMPLYALGPLEGLRIRRLISRVERYAPPATAPHWQPAGRRHRRRRAARADPRRPRGGHRVRHRLSPCPTPPAPRRDRHDRRHDRLRRRRPPRPRGVPRHGRPPRARRAGRRASRAELATVADAREVPFRRLRAHALTDDDLADLVELVRGAVRRSTRPTAS